jgi:uncharacterized protein
VIGAGRDNATNANAPEFRYFRDPHTFSTYSGDSERCDLCGQIRPGYDGPFYGPQDVDRVCEQCLATGRLLDIEGSANEGDAARVREQLAQLHPDLAADQVDALAQARTVEVETRTPHLVTWQSFFWPVHCGDYCCFLREAGKPDLRKLAPDRNGRAFLRAHLYNEDEDTGIEYLWEQLRPDSPTSQGESYTVGVYLFQCLHCQEYVILWDSD